MIIVFDDYKSYFHFLLGFSVPFLGRYGLLIIAIFFLYQLLEKEKFSNKIGDIVEFLAGAGGYKLIHIIAHGP